MYDTIPSEGIALVFGNYIFTDESNEIISGSGANHQSMIADTLAADELTFIVKYNPSMLGYYVPNPAASAGFLYTGTGAIYCVKGTSSAISGNIQPFEEFTYATPIYLYQDGVKKYTYYLTNIAPQSMLQDGSILLKFECVSFIGLTVSMQHDGGLYVNSTAGAIIADILGGTYDSSQSTSTVYYYTMANNLHYTMDKLVANTRVDGHLPSTASDESRSARDNLRDVLFACGISILKNSDGSLYFTYNQPSTPIDIATNKIYAGDAFGTTERVTRVSVIEHAYYSLSSTEEEILYDTGSDIVSNLKVVFDEPCFSLRGDGVTISSSNCNTATISGIGVLYGKPYTHTQQQLTQSTGLTGTDKLVTADNGLITLLNYENVLERVRNYYKNAREVNNSWVLDNGAGTGSLVRFSDPLNREKTGMISELTFTLSGIIKADTTIVTNWGPTEVGNNFEHCAELTGSGTWSKATAEAEIGKTITALRVVVIGGGNGGGNGANGSDGDGNSGGAGGSGGAAGAAGRVKSVSWGSDDTVPATITYSCGSGGAAGSSGTATTASDGTNTYSSADSDAVSPSSGYINIINQNLYCIKGTAGISGAAGGNGGSYVTRASAANPRSMTKGTDGGSVTYNGTDYSGGESAGLGYPAGLVYHYYEPNDTSGSSWTDIGMYFGGSGGGGGAAAGSEGTSTYTGYAVATKGYNNYKECPRIYGAAGGAGGNASAPATNPGYGNGGNGGNGGGGGGGKGKTTNLTCRYLSANNQIISETVYGSSGAAGSGGTGSAGTAGGDGLVIIYY